MHVWNVLHAAHWNNRTQKLRQKSPSAHHHKFVGLSISSQLRHISTIGKKLLNSNISSTCSYNRVNFGPLILKGEIYWPLWGTPANFNGFRVLALLLHQRCSTQISQTLHNVWPSPGVVHTHTHTHIFVRREIYASTCCALLYCRH